MNNPSLGQRSSHLNFTALSSRNAISKRSIMLKGSKFTPLQSIQMSSMNQGVQSELAFNMSIPATEHKDYDVLLDQKMALTSGNNPFGTKMPEEDGDEMSQIVEKYMYLQQPLSKPQLWRFAGDVLGIILTGTIIALPQLELSLLNTLGFLILNKVNKNEDEAYFAFYLLLKALFYRTVTISLESCLTIAASQSFSQNSNKAIGKRYMTQTLFLFAAYTAIFYFPLVFFSPQWLGLLGFGPDLAENCKQLAIKNLCADILESVRSFIMGYCNSQEIEGIFAILSWVNLIPSVILSFVLGLNYDMGIDGWIIGKTVFQFLNTASFFVVYLTKTAPSSRGLCSLSDMWIGIVDFAQTTFGFCIGLTFEILSVEIGTVFNARGNNTHQIAALGAVMNLLYFLFDFSVGFMVACRTRLNYMLGTGYYTAAKKIAIMTLLGQTTVAIVIGSGLYIFRYQVAGLYASHDSVQAEYTVKLVALYSVFIQADIHYSTITMLCRSTNHVGFYIGSFFTFSVLANTAICWYLRFVVDADCVSFFIALYSCFFASIFSCLLRVLFFDWRKIELMASDE